MIINGGQASVLKLALTNVKNHPKSNIRKCQENSAGFNADVGICRLSEVLGSLNNRNWSMVCVAGSKLSQFQVCVAVHDLFRQDF